MRPKAEWAIDSEAMRARVKSKYSAAIVLVFKAGAFAASGL